MIRQYSTRVDVVRNGGTVTTLQTVGDPNVDCDSTARIKASMSATFRANPAVNWLTDELKPIQIIDGVEYPLGLFPVAVVQTIVEETGEELAKVEAYDRGLILSQVKTENILHIAKGTNYIEAILPLLKQAGLGLYLATKTTAVMATDREDWEIGTPYLDIINQLLHEINYGDIWFDSSGTAIMQPEKVAGPDNISHFYGVEEKIKVLKRQANVETDAFELANVFIVICNNPDLPKELVATAENTSPVSSLSVFNRGRRIPKIIRVDNVPSQKELQEYANNVRRDSMLASELATIYTANMPGHGVFDTVSVVHPDLEGIYQEIGWHLILGPGQMMIHNLRKAVII